MVRNCNIMVRNGQCMVRNGNSLVRNGNMIYGTKWLWYEMTVYLFTTRVQYTFRQKCVNQSYSINKLPENHVYLK